MNAVLLLGPTGSGKTPLGEALENHAFFNRRCYHFDFGAQLRYAAEHGGRGLSKQDVCTIQNVLSGGALLENNTFHIARTLLDHFIAAHEATASDLIILNGLPRHAGQARDVDQVLKVKLIVELQCAAETVHARIATNCGGDRAERTDDSTEEIARKLKLYSARTLPLLDHYRAAGVTRLSIPVDPDTVPEDIVETLARQLPDQTF